MVGAGVPKVNKLKDCDGSWKTSETDRVLGRWRPPVTKDSDADRR